MEWNGMEEMLLVDQMSNLGVSNNAPTNQFGYNLTQEEIFKQLHKQKLLDAVKQQEIERNDTTFARNCLLCRKHFTVNRSHLFNHLRDSHHLNIGHPDNIVYANEYLEVLNEKLKNLECFYCEKRFRDWIVLKEHMRKRQHRRLNPLNPVYDKFFVINYLEPGKKWKDFEGLQEYEPEWDNDSIPEVELMTNELDDIICLYCSAKYKDLEDIYQHMRLFHNFDLPYILKERKLDFYAGVRLINHIRMKVYLNECPACTERFPDQGKLYEHLINTRHSSFLPPSEEWDRPDIYYFPVIENDRLITSIEVEYLDESENVPIVIPEDIQIPHNSMLMTEEMRQSFVAAQNISTW